MSIHLFKAVFLAATGSNNWVGAPVAISEVNGQMMPMAPLEAATNIYATFEVKL
ncbi:MAG: DUF3373 family protein [Rhodoferax sp.]